MRRLSYRHERTLARPVQIEGKGFLSGTLVNLRLLPAPVATGVVFVRADLPKRPTIFASVEEVTDTARRTTLGKPPVSVTLVEHILSALAGLRIDNCIIEINGPEPPGLDGSANVFVKCIRHAGVLLQPRKKSVWAVQSAIVLRQPGASIALHPAEKEELRISYFLDYGPVSPLGRQRSTVIVEPGRYIGGIAPSRTFLLAEEAHELRRRGLGAHLSCRDLLVIGERGIIGNRLRFADEPVRHKILDIIGDLSLIGHALCGHLIAYRSGHQLNVELARIVKQRLDTMTEPRQRVA